MSIAANDLKMMYIKRTPESNKAIHIVSSAYKATFTWNNMRTLQVSNRNFSWVLQIIYKGLTVVLFMHLQECREACGGQGYKTENRVGHLKGEYDVQLTFEGDNNVLMQQVGQSIPLTIRVKKKRKAQSQFFLIYSPEVT